MFMDVTCSEVWGSLLFQVLQSTAVEGCGVYCARKLERIALNLTPDARNPQVGSAVFDVLRISCDSWADSDGGLEYRFGYQVCLRNARDETRQVEPWCAGLRVLRPTVANPSESP